MKNKVKVLSTALFLVALITLVSFGGQEAAWKGKIRIEDGVKVVQNPGESLYGEIEFELEEDLSIGKEDDENYMFYGFISILVDSEENILVLDGGNCRIQKFDKNGNYLQKLGGRGQGPGEFGQPMGIHSDLKDNIYVLDSLRRSLHVFDKDGKFRETRRLDHSFLFGLGIAENGNILTQAYFYSPQGNTRDIVTMNSEGKVIKRIASYSDEQAPRINNRIVGNPYSHNLYFYPALDGSGVYGHSSEYKVYILNNSGKTRFVIEKDEKPESITQKAKSVLINRYLERQAKSNRGEKLTRDEVKKAYVFPKFKPFFNRILSDNEGRIYVRRFKLYDSEDKSDVYDLFSEEGYYIYRIKTPLSISIIRNGSIYRIESDPGTGYKKVKRYKIRNWDLIKKEI